MKQLCQYDIFNRLRTVGSKGKPLNERADLIKFFHDRLTTKQGKKYPVGFIGMKLSHLEIQDLYYLKSRCTTEPGRGYKDKDGKEQTLTFGQVFWKELEVKEG